MKCESKETLHEQSGTGDAEVLASERFVCAPMHDRRGHVCRGCLDGVRQRAEDLPRAHCPMCGEVTFSVTEGGDGHHVYWKVIDQ